MQTNNTVIAVGRTTRKKKKGLKPKRKKYTLPIGRQVTRISEPSIKY